MAHSAFPAGMGLNSWFEVPWAQARALNGPAFVVGGANHWLPTAASGDRAVTIAPGRATVCGGAVLDVTDAPETINLPPNNVAGGPRWDAVVARFNWATRTVTFTSVQGGIQTMPTIQTTDPGNAISPQPGVLYRVPGRIYDALIAVVVLLPGAGQINNNVIHDVRPTGAGGAISVPQGEFAEQIDAPLGTTLQIESTGDRLIRRAFGWRMAEPTPWQFSVYTRQTGNGGVYGRDDSIEDSLAVVVETGPGGQIPYALEVNAIASTAALNCAMEVRLRAGNGASDPNLPVITRATNYGNFGGPGTIGRDLDLTLPTRATAPLIGPSRIIPYVQRTVGAGDWTVFGGSFAWRVIPA